MSQSFELEPLNQSDNTDNLEPPRHPATEATDVLSDELASISAGLESFGLLGIVRNVYYYPKDREGKVFKGITFYQGEWAYGIDPTGAQAYKTAIENKSNPNGYVGRLDDVMIQDGLVPITQKGLIETAARDNNIRNDAYQVLQTKVEAYRANQEWMEAGRKQALTIIKSIGL